jgi:molybdopterin-guanine dinucleotide biosynthesis protein
MNRPLTVGVGGFTSEVGKTTLLCNLLELFPEWEAIKTTRGHYRSCGKDPHACCVSHLLQDKPLIKSGKLETYEPGKDTARYWEAGAANVHWVIATDDQLDAGINEALARVTSEGVLIEGNSFSSYVQTDFFVMVARADHPQIKRTARNALDHVSAVYLSDRSGEARQNFEQLAKKINFEKSGNVPLIFSSNEVAQLAERVRRLKAKFLSEKQTQTASVAS